MMASYILFTVVWPAKCIQDDSCTLLNMLKHHHYSRTIWNLQTYLPYYQCTQRVPTQLVSSQHIPHAHLLVWYTQSILLAPPLHYFLMYVTHTHLFGLIPMLLGVQDAPHHSFYPLHSILDNNLIVLGHLRHVDEPVSLLQQALDLHLHVSEVGSSGALYRHEKVGGGETERKVREECMEGKDECGRVGKWGW